MYSSQLTVDRINELLKKQNKSKTALNTFCDIDKGTINSSANKKIGLGAKILYDIAGFLNCSVDYLLGRSDVVSVNRHSGLSEEEERLLFMFRSLTKNDRIRAFDRVQVLYDDEQAALKQE